jgi:cytosine/uracil/thiamine/allantoin permease
MCLVLKLNPFAMKRHLPLMLVALLATTLTSCELVEGIFKAGMWTGVIIVVIILALIIWLVSKVFGGKN